MGKRSLTGTKNHWPDGLHHPWPVGSTVRLRDDRKLSFSGCTGKIVEHVHGGYKVIHASTSKFDQRIEALASMEPELRSALLPVLAREKTRVFVWDYDELLLVRAPDETPIEINEIETDDGWDDWPLGKPDMEG